MSLSSDSISSKSDSFNPSDVPDITLETEGEQDQKALTMLSQWVDKFQDVPTADRLAILRKISSAEKLLSKSNEISRTRGLFESRVSGQKLDKIEHLIADILAKYRIDFRLFTSDFNYIATHMPDQKNEFIQLFKTYHQDVPLFTLAIENGDVAVVEAFLNAGVDINECSKDYGNIAVLWGYPENTPLSVAALKGHFNVVKLLLERDANPNLPKSHFDLNVPIPLFFALKGWTSSVGEKKETFKAIAYELIVKMDTDTLLKAFQMNSEFFNQVAKRSESFAVVKKILMVGLYYPAELRENAFAAKVKLELDSKSSIPKFTLSKFQDYDARVKIKISDQIFEAPAFLLFLESPFFKGVFEELKEGEILDLQDKIHPKAFEVILKVLEGKPYHLPIGLRKRDLSRAIEFLQIRSLQVGTKWDVKSEKWKQDFSKITRLPEQTFSNFSSLVDDIKGTPKKELSNGKLNYKKLSIPIHTLVLSITCGKFRQVYRDLNKLYAEVGAEEGYPEKEAIETFKPKNLYLSFDQLIGKEFQDLSEDEIKEFILFLYEGDTTGFLDTERLKTFIKLGKELEIDSNLLSKLETKYLELLLPEIVKLQKNDKAKLLKDLNSLAPFHPHILNLNSFPDITQEQLPYILAWIDKKPIPNIQCSQCKNLSSQDMETIRQYFSL